MNPPTSAPKMLLNGTKSWPMTDTASPRWRNDSATSSPIKPEPITAQLRASCALADDRFAVGESSEPVNMGQIRAFNRKRARLCPGRQQQPAVAECPPAAQGD